MRGVDYPSIGGPTEVFGCVRDAFQFLRFVRRSDPDIGCEGRLDRYRPVGVGSDTNVTVGHRSIRKLFYFTTGILNPPDLLPFSYVRIPDYEHSTPTRRPYDTRDVKPLACGHFFLRAVGDIKHDNADLLTAAVGWAHSDGDCSSVG